MFKGSVLAPAKRVIGVWEEGEEEKLNGVHGSSSMNVIDSILRR